MKEVLIVGAGASGLMAARILAEKGHHVVVVEARDRTGGRIHTLNDLFSSPVEAGAEFMHGKQPITGSVLKEAGIKTKLLDGKRYQVWDGNRDKGDLFDEEWDALIKKLKKLEKDTSIARFLNENFPGDAHRSLRKKVQGFVEGYDAADMDRVSALALREEWTQGDDEHQYHIEGGYSRLIRYLEESVRKAGGEIVLSSPVREVRWSEGKVSLVCEAGRNFEGQMVIITLPVGVLQKGMVNFVPALPEHQKAFQSMGFGGVVKFFFEFRTAFWEDRLSDPLKDLAFVFSDSAIPTWWTQLPDQTPLLTGWLGGPATKELPINEDEAFLKAIQSLQYVLNCPEDVIQKQLVRRHMVNWVHDPLCFGAYAYPTTETHRTLQLVGKPLKNTVYFSGEGMYNGPAIGTVEAALANGKDVAETMLKQIVRG